MGNKVKLHPQKPQGEKSAKKKIKQGAKLRYSSIYENFHNCSEIYGAKYVNTTHWLAIFEFPEPIVPGINYFLLSQDTFFFPYCPKDYYKTFPTS